MILLTAKAALQKTRLAGFVPRDNMINLCSKAWLSIRDEKALRCIWCRVNQIQRAQYCTACKGVVVLRCQLWRDYWFTVNAGKTGMHRRWKNMAWQVTDWSEGKLTGLHTLMRPVAII